MKVFVFLLAARLAASTIVIDCGSGSDQFFVGGSPYTFQPAADSTARIPTCSPNCSSLSVPLEYKIPVADGVPYVVEFGFNEPASTGVARQFAVTINDTPAIAKVVSRGQGVAFSRSTIAMGADGILDIKFPVTTRGSIVFSIKVTPLAEVAGTPGTGFPEGVGMSSKVAEPMGPGEACQPGDWSDGSTAAASTVGAPLYLCIGGTMRRFRADPEPWGNQAVSDLGGVLQMETQDPDKTTFPPVFWFRDSGGLMYGPFKFAGPGPVPSGLKFPVVIQPVPRPTQ